MGRLKKVLYPGSEYVEYTYDNNGNRLTMEDTRINYGDETFTWEYDDVNRVTKEIYPDDEYITYAYTVGGSRDSIRIPNGSHQKYNYDSRGRLSTIRNTGGYETCEITYTYNTDNTLSQISYLNNVTNNFTYDSLYRIDTIQHDCSIDTICSIDYTYDDVGNKTKAEWDSGLSISAFLYTKIYSYDDIYQLTSEKKMNQAETSRLYEYQYTFDDAGNRSQMKYFDGSTTTTTTYTYNDLNQMTDCDDLDYEYDDNGNMTREVDDQDPLRIFTWNTDNRLTDVENNVGGNNEASYVYDPMGRRLRGYDDDASKYTYYYYDGLTVIAEQEKVGAGSLDYKRVFTVAPGVIGNIFRISTKSGETWSDIYYHYDALGNVVMTSDNQGQVDSSFEQEAYGNVKVGSQSGYHITTKEYDTIPELYYFWQRWYDPVMSIFISKSSLPIYEEHLYGFCMNNPIKYHDTKGLQVIKIPIPGSPEDLVQYWVTLLLNIENARDAWNTARGCKCIAQKLRDKIATNTTVTCNDIESLCECMYDHVPKGWFRDLEEYNIQSQCSWIADQVLNDGRPRCQVGARYK